MKKKRCTQIWVDEEFRKELKAAAAIENIKLRDYTKKLADEFKEKRTRKENDVFKF